MKTYRLARITPVTNHNDEGYRAFIITLDDPNDSTLRPFKKGIFSDQHPETFKLLTDNKLQVGDMLKGKLTIIRYKCPHPVTHFKPK